MIYLSFFTLLTSLKIKKLTKIKGYKFKKWSTKGGGETKLLRFLMRYRKININLTGMHDEGENDKSG